MGYFYFDDSIHDDAGFITGCLVYSEEDLNTKVYNALLKCGLDPEKDEHKSGKRIFGNDKLMQLRSEIFGISGLSKIALTFVPRNKRESLFIHGLNLYYKVVENNDLPKSGNKIFFDQGIFEQKEYSKNIPIKYGELFCHQDSKLTRGIQVADFLAHICSMMLKEKLGLLKKSIPAGENSGYDPEMMIDIGFTFWASIRYQYFQGLKDVSEESAARGHMNVKDYGLLISDDFEPELKEKIQERFEYNYLGCIH